MMGIEKKFVSFNLGPLMALGLGWVWPQPLQAVEKTAVDHHIRRGFVMQKDGCLPSQSIYSGNRVLSRLVFDMPYDPKTMDRSKFESEIRLPLSTLTSSQGPEEDGVRKVEETGASMDDVKKLWTIRSFNEKVTQLAYEDPLGIIKFLDFYIQHSAECNGSDVTYLSSVTHTHGYDPEREFKLDEFLKLVEQNFSWDIPIHVIAQILGLGGYRSCPLFIRDKNYNCVIIAVPRGTKVYDL